MNLLLVRHGPAGDKTEWAKTGKPDFDRPLTPDGAKKTRRAAEGLARLLDRPPVIATSPLVRAAQTADLLQKAFGKARRVVARELEPGRDPEEALRLAAGLGGTAALVGHEPHLSGVLKLATGAGEGFSCELKKAGAALIELDEKTRRGRLIWLAAPSLLRALS